jgi:hypothetical protein
VIRRSPAERYLKYLLLSGLEPDEIIDRALFEHLDPLGNWYLENLQEEMNPPDPFKPKDIEHVASQRYLLTSGVYRLFYPDRHTKIALKVLRTPRAKEYVEAMILSGAPDPVIEEALTHRKNFPSTVSSIKQYRYYFWDVELLDSTELRALLDIRAAACSGSNDSDIQNQFSAYRNSFFNDPRRVAARLPSSPVTAMMAQMRMGVMPVKVDMAKVFELVRAAAGLRAVEAAMSGEIHASEKARDFMLSAKLAGELLETVVRPEEQLINELATIALKTEDAPIPTLQELQGEEGIYGVPEEEHERPRLPEARNTGRDNRDIPE